MAANIKKKNDIKPFKKYLVTQERGIRWLQSKTGIPYATLYSIFIREERTLSDKNKKIINSALNTKF